MKTKRQAEVEKIVISIIKDKGYVPTYQEIADILSISRQGAWILLRNSRHLMRRK